MPYPQRFAGYDSPEALLEDGALTREQKISALQGWRRAARRRGEAGDPPPQRLLMAEIERALAAVRSK